MPWLLPDSSQTFEPIYTDSFDSFSVPTQAYSEDFEVNNGGYTGTNVTATRLTTGGGAFSGTGFISHTTSATGTRTLADSVTDLSIGSTYMLRAWVRSAVAPTTWAVGISGIGSSTAATKTVGVWSELVYTFVATAITHSISLISVNGSTSSLLGYWDAVRIERIPAGQYYVSPETTWSRVTDAYLPGDSGGASLALSPTTDPGSVSASYVQTGLTVGQTYRIGAWFQNRIASGSRAANVKVSGITDSSDTSVAYYGGSGPTAGWVWVYKDFTATGTSHTFTFYGTAPSASAAWRVDGISLTFQEYGPDGWTATDTGAGGAQLVLDPANAVSGNYSMSANTSTLAQQQLKKTISSLLVGTVYYVAASSKSGASSSETQTAYIGVTGKGTSSSQNHTSAGQVKTHSYSFTATSTSHEVVLYSTNTANTGDTLFWDNISLSHEVPNVAPSVTLNSRSTFAPNVSADFTWTFADANAVSGDSQRSYRLVIQKAGVTVYDSGTVMSSATTHTLPANTLDFYGNQTYSWFVTVSDNHTGAYATTTSTAQTFTTSAVQVEPTTYGVENPFGIQPYYGTITFQGYYTDLNGNAGTKLQVEVYSDSAGSSVLWTSPEIAQALTNNAYFTYGWDGDSVIGLAAPGRYYYRIWGWDSTGRKSVFTNINSGYPFTQMPPVAFDVADVPDAPTPVAVGAYPNPYATILLDWTTGITQASYQVQVTRVSTGTVVHDTGKVNSATTSYTMPASTVLPGVDYVWKVRVWDTLDGASPYSTNSSFTTANPGVATITDPSVPGNSIDTSSYTIHWTFTTDQPVTQSKYQVVVTRVADSDVLVNTGMVTSGATSYAITGMQTDFLYNIELTLQNSSGVNTPTVFTTLFPDFNSPAAPTASFVVTEAYIQINITNPPPTGDRPEPGRNEIWRKDIGEYTLRGEANPDGQFRDYLIAADTKYTYFIKAVTD